MDPSNGIQMTISQADAKAAIQSIFSSTSCYDLMQNSSKALVFEAQIPFQLAFYALIEHGKCHSLGYPRASRMNAPALIPSPLLLHIIPFPCAQKPMWHPFGTQKGTCLWLS